MVTLVLRVWLPDRPGALGAVATRVGAVRGDVVGIDIIERGAGRAVDDLVVLVPDEGVVDLLVAEVREVDGVDVEDVRVLDGPPDDPTVLALELADELRSAGPDERFEVLARGARRLLHADWVAVVDDVGGVVLHSEGAEVPSAAWLVAFTRGMLTDGDPAELEDLAAARVDGGPVLVASRHRAPFRGTERTVMTGLIRLVRD